MVASDEAVAKVSLSGDHVMLFTAPVWPVSVAAMTAEASDTKATCTVKLDKAIATSH